MLCAALEVSAQDTAEAEFRLLREKMVKEQISDAPDYRDPVKDPRGTHGHADCAAASLCGEKASVGGIW